jgi:hypothetical protein
VTGIPAGDAIRMLNADHYLRQVQELRHALSDARWRIGVLEELLADSVAETQEVACELLDERALLERALPIVRYVSMGRGFVGVEPYPDAAARALLGAIEEKSNSEAGKSNSNASDPGEVQ